MNKVNEVEVKSASRLRAICQPLDGAVRAAVALGAAVLVGSAPFVAYAAIPPAPFLIDGRDGGIYALINGQSASDSWGNAPILANPNFGAQSEYEAYILSLDPANRPAEASSAVVIPSPNFGSQSQYEAYIASLGPPNLSAEIVNAAAVESSYPFVQANGKIISLGVNRMEAAEAAVVGSYGAPVMNDRDERVFLAVGGNGFLTADRVPESTVNPSRYSSYAAPVMIDKDERAFLAAGPNASLTISPDGWPVAAAPTSNGMVYRSPTLPDLAEGAAREVTVAGSGDVSLANIAPSSAAMANGYAYGNAASVRDATLANSAPSSAAVANEYAEGHAQDIEARNTAVITSNESSVAASSGPREITVVGPGDFAEGYTWYVEPEILRAARIPNEPVAVSTPEPKKIVVVGPGDFAEGYDWYADLDVLRAARIPNLTARGVASPRSSASVVLSDRLRGPYDAPIRSSAAASGRVSHVVEGAVALSSAAQPMSGTDASMSNNGYDWFVEHIAERAVTTPHGSSWRVSQGSPAVDTSPLWETGDWFVNPVMRGRGYVPAPEASSGADRYNWDADPELLLLPAYAVASPGSRQSAVQFDGLSGLNSASAPSPVAAQTVLSPEQQLQALYQNGHITRGVMDAEIAAQTNMVRGAAQLVLSPEEQLQALYQNGHITRGVMDAEIAAQANMARGNEQVTPAALSPEEQLQSLYENGHIPYELTQAEIAAYAWVPPAGAQVAQSSEAAEAELQALYQNGHISRAVMEAEIASYRSGAPSGPVASMARSYTADELQSFYQRGFISKAVRDRSLLPG